MYQLQTYFPIPKRVATIPSTQLQQHHSPYILLETLRISLYGSLFLRISPELCLRLISSSHLATFLLAITTLQPKLRSSPISYHSANGH